MIVAIDFDGTITESSVYGTKGFNRLSKEAEKAIWELHHKGVKFYLLTGRNGEYVKEAVDLVTQWKLPIDCSSPTRKRLADFYIDDKAVGVPMWHGKIDWDRIELLVLSELLSTL